MRKNLFVTLLIILIVNFVSAQPTRFGFYAGPVAANMFQKISGVKHNTGYVMGATIGILLDVPMQKYGSFQPGLNFITKNSKDNFTSGGKQVNTRTLLSYVELPLNVLFRVPGKNGHVTLGCGVAPAVAVSGKLTTTVVGSSKDDKDLSFGNSTHSDFGRFDFGLNALAGYEFKSGFFVTFNYNYGINRLFVGGDEENKLFNRYFALRCGFLLGGGK